MKKNAESSFSRPLWWMKIYPLWLREKFFWKFISRLSTESVAYLFSSAKLLFAPTVSLKLNPTDLGHKMIATCGFTELNLTKRISKLAKIGGTMIDVGANYGYYTCIWASSNQNNCVISFEASPRNYPALTTNLESNKLTDRVSTYNLAIGKESGELPFSLGPSDQTGWGGLALSSGTNDILVPVVSLDEILSTNSTPVIDVLKIDTEGADTWVLYGAKNLLASKRIRNIFFEENIERMTPLGITPGEAQDFLRSFNYKIEQVSSDEWHASLPSFV